jgi:hypothetical protein
LLPKSWMSVCSRYIFLLWATSFLVKVKTFSWKIPYVLYMLVISCIEHASKCWRYFVRIRMLVPTPIK